MRSLRVAKWLRDQGFSLVQSMRGGIDAWTDEVDPSVPKY
jgi:rhodanese-related sulfurtransferase